MRRYERHTLLDINVDGRTQLFREAVAKGYGREICGAMLLPEEFPVDVPRANAPNAGPHIAIPGIVRREDQSPRPDAIAIGFTSWTSGAMGRLRLPGFILPKFVVRSRDAVTVLRESCEQSWRFVRTPALRAVAVLQSMGLRDAQLGVWGSVGLELATNYEYTHAMSDLDLLIRAQAPLTEKLLRAWFETVLDVENRFEVRIDAELCLTNGYGVSLKECLKGTARVLGKGIDDVRLLAMSEVYSDKYMKY